MVCNMAENTTITNSDIPFIRGSTADILLGLYANAMDAKNISTDNPTLRTLVQVDAKTAALKEPLAQPLEVEEYNALTSVALERLKGVVNNPEAKRLRELYDGEYQAIKPAVVKVIDARENLLVEYKAIVKDQHLSATEILSAIKANKEANKNKVRELVNKESIFANKVQNVLETARDLTPRVEATYTKVAQLLPESELASIPALAKRRPK